MYARRLNSILSAAAAAAVTLVSPALVFAQDGEDIARQVDQADRGWGDEQVVATMTLRARDGREATRSFRTISMETGDDGDKSLVIFDEPADVRGTVFLTHAHKTGEDDQWLYLPALSRVKRISSSNRSGPFMGSEFAFEDVSSEEIERYTYAYVGEEPCGEDLLCHVYERFPVDASSGYTKQIVYADTEHLRIIRTEYFDRKGAHLKTLEREGYSEFGGYWRAERWVMTNHLNGKVTTVVWGDREFGLDLGESDFDRGALSRYR